MRSGYFVLCQQRYPVCKTLNYHSLLLLFFFVAAVNVRCCCDVAADREVCSRRWLGGVGTGSNAQSTGWQSGQQWQDDCSWVACCTDGWQQLAAKPGKTSPWTRSVLRFARSAAYYFINLKQITTIIEQQQKLYQLSKNIQLSVIILLPWSLFGILL